jgi:hypothetical protein
MNPIILEAIRRDQERRSSSNAVELRETKRKEWLIAVRQNPRANRTCLQRKVAPQVYSWLHTHDNDWLKENMPSPFKRTKSAREIVDWKNRDIALENEVREAAARLKRADGKPVQVTVTAIARELDRNELLMKRRHLAKLHLTRRALNEVVENRPQFALRRLRWAADCFRGEGSAPAKSSLALRACVDYEVWKGEKMGAALDAEWRSLQKLPDQNEITP